MPEAVDVDVLVVGAGPVGLTLAIDLAWRGINVTVVETRAAAAKPAEFPFSEADLQVLRVIDERIKLCIPPEAGE